MQTWPVASIYGVAVMDGDTIPVPEPGSILLLGLGCFFLAARKKISSIGHKLTFVHLF